MATGRSWRPTTHAVNPIDTISLTHPAYPPRLRKLLNRPPETLFVRGEIPLDRTMVAVVGTRGARKQSTELAFGLGRKLTHAGFVVVSGGAVGVDAAAHMGALSAGGPTVAVLGSGLDQPYPERNRRLFEDIAAAGALVSPYAAGTPPRRGNFPARNKLVAALSRAVVVAEAPLRSGALNTARHARSLGTPVLAAEHGAGALALLRRGAGLVESVDDVICALNGGPLRARRVPPQDPDEARALAQLGGKAGQRVDAVAGALGWTPSRAAAALLRLELDGWVRSGPGGLFFSTRDDPNAGTLPRGS